ncbi:Receptor-type tyrosine- phosphatase F, partial [Paramuricea clavata]
MKKNFARHGIPSECVSDNGPQFDSSEYRSFARECGFTPVKSSPYSQGNGKAESAVKVAKNILKKSGNEDPYLALLAYRNTPQQGYVYSPSEILIARKLKDIIPMVPSQLKPRLVDSKIVREDIMKRRIQSKIQYDKKASRPLKDLAVDDRVYVKPRQKYKPWIYGKVIERPDERTCVMQTPLGLVRRNRKHLRKIKGE